MAAIAADLCYICKSGRLPLEDDRGEVRQGAEALRDLADQWRCGGARIAEQSARREAFNFMLAMPAGTQPEIVRNAVREFAQAVGRRGRPRLGPVDRQLCAVLARRALQAAGEAAAA
jgi:hypothetical protein